ncbi:hypothetical protein H257_18393 [Aphanomyces astaci]|uniref:Uncharacterized protein n=1 Tax=Aphanomyces astaci TaxID=112090 RepID=W4FD03_APHAT|nr:hypothetical protein H257_18393 [Aphanomyces astaci]ETV64779.1 hypothetical protein H257_18393 [Aphanomyces astaci]|eukprot:XP_009845736.1 hypothetical protein H257_18393 [Aphanomyces astaci]
MSDFLCPCHGRLFILGDSEPLFVTEELHVASGVSQGSPKASSAYDTPQPASAGSHVTPAPPRCEEKHVVLACLLHVYTAPVEHKTICELFGMPPTTLSRVLLNAECALLRALKSIPEASIRFPDHATQID